MGVAGLPLSQACLLAQKKPNMMTWNLDLKARRRAVWLCQAALWGTSAHQLPVSPPCRGEEQGRKRQECSPLNSPGVDESCDRISSS